LKGKLMNTNKKTNEETNEKDANEKGQVLNES
jgi:hypothetical protein